MLTQETRLWSSLRHVQHQYCIHLLHHSPTPRWSTIWFLRPSWRCCQPLLPALRGICSIFGSYDIPGKVSTQSLDVRFPRHRWNWNAEGYRWSIMSSKAHGNGCQPILPGQFMHLEALRASVEIIAWLQHQSTSGVSCSCWSIFGIHVAMYLLRSSLRDWKKNSLYPLPGFVKAYWVGLMFSHNAVLQLNMCIYLPHFLPGS